MLKEMDEMTEDVKKRLTRQIEEISRMPLKGVLMSEDLEIEEFSGKIVWKMMLMGGEHGPFKDGFFDIEFQYPKNYPFHPPRPLPDLALDLWSVAKTTKYLVVKYRQRMLVDVDMFDPNKGDKTYCVSDKEIEQQLYLSSKEEFMRRAVEHTKKNGAGQKRNIYKRVQKLLKMDKLFAIIPDENEDHFYCEFEKNDTLYEGGINSFGKYHGRGKVYILKKSRIINRRLESMLQYEGDFVNGERSGIGTEFSSSSGKKIFSGIWENGQKNGRGMKFSQDGEDIEFEGIWKNGELIEKITEESKKDEFKNIEL